MHGRHGNPPAPGPSGYSRGFDTVGGSRYGLGIATFTLSCGGFAWTHGGVAPGYVTSIGIAPSGKAASIAATSLIGSPTGAEHLDKALDTALCD